MDEVEVDPQLFVKCRLCLKDTGGMFQIVPKVRDQIKFCFDIEVEQFDGLPQLICKICRNTLKEYYETKTTFTENQKSLKAEISVKQEQQYLQQNTAEDPVPAVCHSPQQTTVTSSQEIEVVVNNLDALQNDDTAADRDNGKAETKVKEVESDSNESDDDLKISKPRKKRPCLRLTSASSEGSNQRSVSPLLKQMNKSRKKISWKNNFNKKIVCMLCQKQCKNKGNLSNHIEKHVKLISKHEKVFDKCCIVKMNRIDDKPNVTGSLNKVVLEPTKIISHGHRRNIAYYVLYSPNENKISPIPKAGPVESSEDEESFKRKGSKRARLLSKSSNETVVLEKDSKISPRTDKVNSKNKDVTSKFDPDECINIDDSSNSDMDITSSGVDFTVKPNYKDYNKIHNIVTICRNKFSKKIESAESDLQVETLLKHKILNMGRKVINKQGFNCTGLLRYMEHKNLDIVWTPTTQLNTCKDTSYVRIMPKLKGKEKPKNDKWIKIPGTQVKDNKESCIDDMVSEGEINSTVIGLPVITSTEFIANLINNTNDQAVLYANSNEIGLQNKLLNANPVANPKQLPKKGNVLESKSAGKIDSQSMEQPEENTELCMPIITSTTSLAVPSATEKQANSTDNETPNAVNEVERSVPRIKVKPVSELMSERVLKNLSQQQMEFPSNIWSVNHDVSTVQQPTGNVALGVAVVVSPTANVTNFNQNLRPSVPQVTNREYVILHTTELPNHKTDSPFRYLKQLLYIHNIILLDPNEPIPENFVCLIKFKLQYKQENVAQPVILLITFSCSENTFQLGVKHSGNQENIDLNQLPANWQWNILNKIYQEEVVNKVLKNAQKINTVTHESTKKFFCLLKSIQFRKIT